MLRTVVFVIATAFFLQACSNQSTTQPATAPDAGTPTDTLTRRVAALRELQEKGRSAEALKEADHLLQRYPGSLDALGIKAEILKEQGRNAEALAVLETAYSLQPRDKETAYNLAYEYAEGKSPKTLPLTDTLLKYDKTETVARAWYIRATYFLGQGKEREALRCYDSSAAADFNFLDTYLDKGKLLFKQRRYDDALKTFARGQKLSPATGDFYYWVAKTQEALGQSADARANYDRAFALDPGLRERE